MLVSILHKYLSLSLYITKICISSSKTFNIITKKLIFLKYNNKKHFLYLTKIKNYINTISLLKYEILTKKSSVIFTYYFNYYLFII